LWTGRFIRPRAGAQRRRRFGARITHLALQLGFALDADGTPTRYAVRPSVAAVFNAARQR
jgi:hypothetical protein